MSGSYAGQASGAATGHILLYEGCATTVRFKVTAQDGTTTKVYTTTITHAASHDKTLHSLSLHIAGSSKTFYPAFAAGTLSYAANVAHGETFATVNVSAYKNGAFLASSELPAGTVYTGNEAMAAMTVQGIPVANNGNSVVATSAAIPLTSGVTSENTVISIVVTAQDGTATTYTLTVSRIGLNTLTTTGSLTFHPAFQLTTYSYTITAPNALASIALTPTATTCLTAGCTAQIMSILPSDGSTAVGSYTAITSGAASSSFPLSEGNTTTFRIKDTDTHNATLIQTYEVKVFRQPSAADTLSGITTTQGTLSPAFSAAHTGYAISVGNTVTSLSMTPTMTHPVCCAVVEGIYFDKGDGIWGQHTYWGTDSQPAATDSIPLIEGGVTNVRFKVVAQDTTSFLVYTIAVTRAQNTDKTLHSLTVNTGNGAYRFTREIFPVFTANTVSYMLNVDDQESAFDVTATAYNSANGRGPSMPTTTAYGADVNPAPGRVYTTQSARAVIKVNGVRAYTGNTTALTLKTAASDPTTTTRLEVTAQDGGTTMYTLQITRIGLKTLNTTSIQSAFTPGGPPWQPWTATGTETTNTLVFRPTFFLSDLPYDITAPNNIAFIKFTPTGADTGGFSQSQSYTIQAISSLPVNGELPTVASATIASGAASSALPLSEGNTTNFKIKVQDVRNSSTLRIYNINVFRTPSIDDTLSSLTVTESSLSPAFSPTTNDYTITVANSVSSLQFTPTRSHYVCCNARETAGLHRSTETLEFSAGDTGLSSTGETLGATARWQPQFSTVATTVVPLVEGGVTTVRFRVFAQNSTYVRIYNVAITRAQNTDFTLHTLKLFVGYSVGHGGGLKRKMLVPTFNPATLTYNLDVENHDTECELTMTAYNSATGRGVALPTTFPNGSDVALDLGRAYTGLSARAHVLVNGTTLLSGHTTEVMWLKNAFVAATITPIPISVTAQDGTAQTYQLILNRVATPVPTPAPTKAAGNNTNSRVSFEITLQGIMPQNFSFPVPSLTPTTAAQRDGQGIPFWYPTNQPSLPHSPSVPANVNALTLTHSKFPHPNSDLNPN